MLITIIDIFFVISGLVAIIIALKSCPYRIKPEEVLPVSYTELLLTTLALIPAAVGPNILVVALTPGMPKMHELGLWLLLPSFILLVIVWIFSYYLGLSRLTNRIWTGLWSGACCTSVLDIIRLSGFYIGWLPGNMPRMFGVLLLNQMALGPSLLSDIIGSLYHYWVGACFGLTYALFIGHTRWYGPLIWGIFIEIGMMVTPPMVIAMDTGFFGIKYGKGYEIITVSGLAHLAYGFVLGLLIERYVKHSGCVYLEAVKRIL